MSSFNQPLKPFSAWVIVNYRWSKPYVLTHTIHEKRADAIKSVTDWSGWPWKKHYRMKMRAVHVQVIP